MDKSENSVPETFLAIPTEFILAVSKDFTFSNYTDSMEWRMFRAGYNSAMRVANAHKFAMYDLNGKLVKRVITK